MTSLLLGISILALTAPPDSCRGESLLPAYAHNDYRNARPLHDALALGYRGVEADLFRLDTALVVAHARRERRATNAFARLYLDPLRDRVRRCGRVLPDSTSFLLNVELKEADERAFRLLLDALGRYPELFHPPGAGGTPPVRLVLVGWWPSVARGEARWPEYLGVQHVVAGSGAGHADTTLAISLITIDYGKTLRWNGEGPVPAKSVRALAEARRLAMERGVPLRVHHAPEDLRVYRWLVAGGVTFVGAIDLARTRDLLGRLTHEPLEPGAPR